MNLHGSIQLRVNLRTIKGEWFSQCGQESTRLCPSLSKHSILSVHNWANCPRHTFSLHLNSILSLRHHPSNHKAVPSVSHDLCNGVCTAWCSHYCDKIPGTRGERVSFGSWCEKISLKLEVAGCTAPALRKQGRDDRWCWTDLFFLPFWFSLRSYQMGGTTHTQSESPPQ